MPVSFFDTECWQNVKVCLFSIEYRVLSIEMFWFVIDSFSMQLLASSLYTLYL